MQICWRKTSHFFHVCSAYTKIIWYEQEKDCLQKMHSQLVHKCAFVLFFVLDDHLLYLGEPSQVEMSLAKSTLKRSNKLGLIWRSSTQVQVGGWLVVAGG